MQQESERGILGDVLDGKELLPDWDKSAAWRHLETRLNDPAGKVIPLWLYTSAAAALLLLGVFVFRQDTITGVSIAQQQNVTAVNITTPTAKPVTTIDTLIKNMSVHEMARAVRNQRRRTMQPIVSKTVEPISPIKGVPATAIDLPGATPVAVIPAKIKKTFSEPVYTLSEIMDNVPEREEKPKTFTGIFHLKPAEMKDNDPLRGSNKFFQSRPNQEQLNNDN